MIYVDGFVAAVPKANRDAFKRHCADAAAVFLENGAVRVVECLGVDVPRGKLTDFHMAVQANDDEDIMFSWIEWPSREVRDVAMAKIMQDPRLQPANNPMPFDGKRLIFGSFAPVIDERA